MVGRLNLADVCEAEPLDMMSCRADRGLDSPDSGLPPSPSPGAWLLPGCVEKPGAVSPVSEDEGRESLVPVVSTGSLPQLHPLSYGEGIALVPLPAKEVRYISSVHYNSDRHFIQDVALQPRGQGLEHCLQTVMAVPGSTWRRYRTQLDFQPRQRLQRVRTTTIIYPKKTSAVFTTELSYDCRRLCRRFLSSVELEAGGHRKMPQ